MLIPWVFLDLKSKNLPDDSQSPSRSRHLKEEEDTEKCGSEILRFRVVSSIEQEIDDRPFFYRVFSPLAN